MSERGRRIRNEEAALWQRVSRDVTPLPRGAVVLEEAETPEEEAPQAATSAEEDQKAPSCGAACGGPGTAPASAAPRA